MTEDQLFFINPGSRLTIQEQLRRLIIDAILNGHFKLEKPLPSCRRLARNLGVSKNTVILVYEYLRMEGYLISRERVGYFVNSAILEDRIETKKLVPVEGGKKVNWRFRYTKNPSAQKNVIRPEDWQNFIYPFIYGQPDPALFPLEEWRKCTRQSQEVAELRDWAVDCYDNDDPKLIEEIRTVLLPRRGIHVSGDEIVVTLGVQHALYLLADLFFDSSTKVGIEDPGYVDARNIFLIQKPALRGVPVGREGLVVDEHLDDLDFIYFTPSHQYPTTVTMPLETRLNLLKRAAEEDFILIEDDYESEMNHLDRATPAVKSLDKSDRVIYVSSLSKLLAPGLRLGYMVAPKEVVKEVKALRKLMLRHPPADIQRTVALFIARGDYSSYVRRMRKVYRERWELMNGAIKEYLPTCTYTPTTGGSAFWISGPKHLNTAELEAALVKRSVIIERGSWFYLSENAPANYFRLGFSAIQTHKIKPGVKRIGETIKAFG